HRVGLREPNPELVGELVVGGIGGGGDRDAHGLDCRTRFGSGRPRPTLHDVTPAVRELEAAGIAFTLHEYERGESLHDFGAEAAEKLGLDPDQVFKTLLVSV